MKFNIEGEGITKQDLIEIGKFFREKWKDREDIVSIFVEKGTEDMNKEEAMKLIQEIFE